MSETPLSFFNTPERSRPAQGTQCGELLAHLEKYGSITPREAMQGYLIYRLAARIKDLREMGYAIETINEKHDGGTHARYVLL